MENINDKSTNGLLVWLENAACFLDEIDTIYLQAHIFALAERYGVSIDELPACAYLNLHGDAVADTVDPEGAHETAHRLSQGVSQCQQELLRRLM